MQPAKLLAGKRGLVMGVANDKSIAWGIAAAAAAQGAEIAFSYQMEGFGKRLKPLAESIGSDILIACDVAAEGAVQSCFDDPNGNQYNGFVDDSDVYGVIGANISFHDRDAGYSVTQGDYFVIDSETIGSKDGTWGFKLIDQSSNTLLFDIGLTIIED